MGAARSIGVAHQVGGAEFTRKSQKVNEQGSTERRVIRAKLKIPQIQGYEITRL